MCPVGVYGVYSLEEEAPAQPGHDAAETLCQRAHTEKQFAIGVVTVLNGLFRPGPAPPGVDALEAAADHPGFLSTRP